MTRQHEGTGDDELCSCGQKHTGHICWLTRMGLLNEVAHLSGNPTATCARCGARADRPDNLCHPETR